jgi:two-component system KDP operon response regulator KdpE
VTRVLLVEDERPLLRALAMNLVARGYAVTEAGSGARALSALADQRHDVIVLDLGLPDMSGVDVIRAVRAYATTPIIVLSARSGSADKVEALDVEGQPVHLTPTEWKILDVLLRRPGKLVSGDALLTAVRGSSEHTDPSYLRIYLAQLRRKLEPEPSRPRHLITEPGMGYRYRP